MESKFEIIYQIALAQDEYKLRKLISTGNICIDEFQSGRYMYPALARLAVENNIPAVEFLIKFGANPNFAAFGAGLGGHRIYGEALLKRELACINFFAEGLAFHGDKDYCNELILRGADVCKVATCALIGGHEDYADYLVQENKAQIYYEMMGYFQGVDNAYGSQLLAAGLDINVVATTAAILNNTTYAMQLIQSGANKDSVIVGAAHGGHRALAESLMEEERLDEALMGAANGGQRDYFQQLLKRGAKLEKICFLTYPFRPYLSGAPEQQIKFLSFFASEYAVELIQKIKEKNPQSELDKLYNRLKNYKPLGLFLQGFFYDKNSFLQTLLPENIQEIANQYHNSFLR
jgi:hypothetical protein